MITYKDYKDPNILCLKKADKFDLSLTNSADKI